MADRKGRSKTGKGPDSVAGVAIARRRPADLTLLRGEEIPAAKQRPPQPGDAEREELVRDLRAACREIREAIQRLRQWFQVGCPQPGLGRGPSVRAPRRDG
jgi:hypothetical protein